MFRKILVAHDGSEGAHKAMAVAIDLASRDGAELHLISVIEELPTNAATIDAVEEVKAQAMRCRPSSSLPSRGDSIGSWSGDTATRPAG
jgi:nucleotide-binding universal stress UspA family protein